MITRKKFYHNFAIIASVLLVLIPPALVSGPFIPDLFIVLISIIFLFIFSSNKYLNLFQSNFFKLFLLFYSYLIFTSLLSDNFFQSFKPSITYFKVWIIFFSYNFFNVQQLEFKKIFLSDNIFYYYSFTSGWIFSIYYW